ncbi:MAG TPA: CCA tRNA nucleotidyltransferase [Alphaproteobacteria bacterium]|nr:CCA tRNA nucleotidyltransferase [Alphaproteobacteria bacterium]
MTERRTLPVMPWMSAPETRAVIVALEARGAEVRFVGGCVRDALLGRPVTDLDLATPDPPETVTALLEKAGIRAVPTGLAHGTMTAVLNHRHFEITTLRRDVETFGRRARVAFTDDWAEDAARRDFTMNALSLSPDGRLFDPFGGVSDAESGRVRFVGDPAQRIDEDHLRILRFFRFYAHYGTPPPDAAALAACAAKAALIARLSGERVRGEMMRILSAPDPAGVLALMGDCGALAEVLPEPASLAALESLAAIEAEEDKPDGLRRLSVVLRDGDKPQAAGAQVAERWRLSRAESARLASLVSPEPEIAATLSPKAQRARLYALGAQLFRDRVFIAWAERRALLGEEAAAEASFRAMLGEAQVWQPRKLPVKGADVQRLGVAPGPRVGALLEAVEAWWIEEDFAPDRAQCLAKLEDLIATGHAR